ncbi:helix-turn-helix transcriptional regulator [Microbacteriaceae bacterium 4G12]
MPTTTSRLIALLSLLQARRDWPGALLAERLDISHRTVRRDIDRLREMGYSIRATMGPDGGYRLDAGTELPPLLFDDDQVVALAVALQAASQSGAGIEEAAVRALTTVRQVIPSRLRHRLDSLAFTTIPARPGDGAGARVAPPVLVALSTAVRAREVLRFDYASRAADDAAARDDSENAARIRTADDRAPRRVEPHVLATSLGRWYLVAWDLDAQDWRIFRADRITPRTPTGPRFRLRELPGGVDAATYLTGRFRGSDRGGGWPCTGTVVLHLPAAEVLPFAGDGVVEDLGADRCGLTAGSWSWLALAASLNRFDTDIDVLDPPELRQAFARLAARNAATGREAPTRSGPVP